MFRNFHKFAKTFHSFGCFVIGTSGEIARGLTRARQEDEYEGNDRQRVRRRLLMTEEEVINKRHENELGERGSEMSGHEQNMNGQVVGTRVIEVGLSVINYNGRGGVGCT